MSFGIQGIGSNKPTNGAALFAPQAFLPGLPSPGVVSPLQQTQQTASVALSAVGQLQGSYLGILGAETLFAGEPLSTSATAPEPDSSSSLSRGFVSSSGSKTFALLSSQMSAKKEEDAEIAGGALSSLGGLRRASRP